jgi:hypothetical protein
LQRADCRVLEMSTRIREAEDTAAAVATQSYFEASEISAHITRARACAAQEHLVGLEDKAHQIEVLKAWALEAGRLEVRAREAEAVAKAAQEHLKGLRGRGGDRPKAGRGCWVCSVL